MHSAIVLDINAGSVGAGVVLLRKRLPPALLYEKRLYFHPALSQSHRAYRQALRTTLNQILRQTLHDGLITLSKNDKVPRKPDHILIALSSVWEEGDLDLVEEEVLKVLGSRRGLCAKDRTFVLAHSLGRLRANDSIIASVSGEATEWLALDKLGEQRPQLVPFGPARISRAISDGVKLDYHLASSLLSLFSENLLGGETRAKVEKIISQEIEKWRESIFSIEGAQKTKEVRLFVPRENAWITARAFKLAFPSAEIILEKNDPLERLAVFSNSLL